jgi:hypothetical protein
LSRAKNRTLKTKSSLRLDSLQRGFVSLVCFCLFSHF